MGRWDDLLDRKPQELKDYVLDQVADSLAADLRAFPAPLNQTEWLDDTVRARSARALARATPPELDTLRVALELAREELLREYELIDRFCRSAEYRRLLPDALEEETAHLVSRYLVDAALAFQEFAMGKFRRAELVTLMEKIEDRLLRGFRLRI